MKRFFTYLTAALLTIAGAAIAADPPSGLFKIVTMTVGWSTPTFIDIKSKLTDAQRAEVASGVTTLDLAPAIQAAENSMGAAGGTLYFSPGVYRTDSSVLLSSNRRVECAKGAVFKPIYKFQIFANDNYATVNLGTDLDPPTDANQTDHDFEISGCKFDWTAVTDANSPSPIWSYDSAKPAIFVKAKNVYFHDNEVVGSDPPKFNGSTFYGHVGSVACVSTDNCRYERNIAKGVHESLDCWGGGNGCYYRGNRVELFDNETFKRGDHYCLGFNGMGSISNFHNTIKNLEVSGSYCITKGWSSCYQFDPLSAGSKVEHVKITNNVCEAKSGTTNNGIYGRGQIEDALIDGNTIKGVDALPINVTDFFSTGGPFTCTDCISTTNGSDIVTVAITTLTDSKATVGNYLQFVSASAVGGITLSGKWFPITEVTSGVNVKVKADVAASSTAGPLGGSVSTNVWWGRPNGVRITNNRFKNAGYANSGLVSAQGDNIQIGNNSADRDTFGPFTCTDCISTTNASKSVVVAIPFTATDVYVNNGMKFGAGVTAVGGITFAGKTFKVTAVNPGVSATVEADVAASSTAGPLGGSVSVDVQRGIYGAITYASSFYRNQTNLPIPSVYGTLGPAGTGIAGTSGDGIDNFVLQRNPTTRFPAIALPCGADPTTSALQDGELWCNTSGGLKLRLGGTNVQLGAAAAPLSVTKTVRDSAGTGSCTLTFTNGLLTGGSC